MRGYRLMCPLHGATFDIRDGSVTGAPATRANSLLIRSVLWMEWSKLALDP